MTMERLGLVGLPNAGKSSLFNALTSAAVPVAPHPFSTTETSVGTAEIDDPRLERLAAMSASRKIVHASFEVLDIAALVAGSAHGEGLGNRFLAQIREVDALCIVLRAFEDPEVAGGNDPVDALATLELELVMADTESLENQLARRRKAAVQDRSLGAEVAAAEQALTVLSGGTPLWRSSVDPVPLKGYFLLTAKPVLAVVNIGEDQVGTGEDETLVKAVAGALGGGAPGTANEVLAVCVQLEAEAVQLEGPEKREMLEGLGLGPGALARVARAALNCLGRRTFFTTGEKESRAWTFRHGSRAPECAGVIHSDLQRGFIRAEVIDWEVLLNAGSWSAAKAAGKVRVEGKDYVVDDGDVLEIRFNV